MPTVAPPTPERPPEARITARITLPHPADDRPQTPFPDQLAVTDGAIWIVWWASDRNRLIRIDAGGGSISASTELPFIVTLAAGDGGLWATGPYGYAPGPASASVFRVDLDSAGLAEIAQVPHGGNDFVAGLGSLWAVGGDGLARLDQSTGERLGILQPPAEAYDYLIRCGALWALGSADGEHTDLWRLDPNTGAPAQRITADGWAGEPVGTPEACWLATESSLRRLTVGGQADEPSTSGRRIVVAGASVWTLSQAVIRRIDLETGMPIDPGWRIDPELLDASEKGGRLQFLDAGGYLWLLNRDQVIRLDIPTT